MHKSTFLTISDIPTTGFHVDRVEWFVRLYLTPRELHRMIEIPVPIPVAVGRKPGVYYVGWPVQSPSGSRRVDSREINTVFPLLVKSRILNVMSHLNSFTGMKRQPYVMVYQWMWTDTNGGEGQEPLIMLVTAEEFKWFKNHDEQKLADHHERVLKSLSSLHHMN